MNVGSVLAVCLAEIPSSLTWENSRDFITSLKFLITFKPFIITFTTLHYNPTFIILHLNPVITHFQGYFARYCLKHTETISLSCLNYFCFQDNKQSSEINTTWQVPLNIFQDCLLSWEIFLLIFLIESCVSINPTILQQLCFQRSNTSANT